MIEIDEIMKRIPHRYPFLLIDRVLELEPGKKGIGLKNVTINEPFFQGHFPGIPIMPGVLIVEAMAQLGAVAVLSMPEHKNRLAFFAGIDNMRFRRKVIPGDQLRLEIEIIKIKGVLGKGVGTATVEGDIAAHGTILFALGDNS
ncbi:MAG: 3-hydroxyacyl-ACP dehydratase FabZ [Clostridiales bacterium]|nr:3-hydroxyacyl-ACP dehydratase FabZ [Clostridiales bacterium]